MKNIVLSIFLLGLSSPLFSQIDPGLNGLQPKDSSNFSTNWSRLSVDTQNVNNNWVIGNTNKPFFMQASSLPNAIMTDSLNPYSNSNLSYFDVSFSAWDGSGFPYNMYIQFDHKYETDSMIDGGYITVSHDSGQTWQNVLYDSTCIGCFNTPYNINIDNLYSYGDTLLNGEPGFSGTSSWQTTTIQWIWLLPVKQTPSDSLIIRFNFISDSIQTNKDGWMIDNFIVGDIYQGSSVDELHNNLKVNIYPNITSDFFRYKTEEGSIDNLVITNLLGESVLIKNNLKELGQVNISNLPSGNYFVRFNSKDGFIIKRLFIN